MSSNDDARTTRTLARAYELADAVRAIVVLRSSERDRTLAHREIVTLLLAFSEDVSRELADELDAAIRAHDNDVARLRAELREARDLLVQTTRERDQARAELAELAHPEGYLR